MKPGCRGLLAAVALVSWASSASADERVTDDTAYVIQQDRVRLGLWKVQYGVHGVRGLEVGTYPAPYLGWAFGLKVVNAHARYRIVERKRWALTAGVAATWVDFAGRDTQAQLTVVPWQLVGAVPLGRRFTLGLGLMYTQLHADGTYNEDEESMLRGAVAVSNVQSWVSLTTQLSRGWSLYVESRAVSSVDAAAQAGGAQQLDDRTRVELSATGAASIDELRGGSWLVAAQYSRTHLRVRFGGGWGNFNIPAVNFIVPVALPFPELDVSWVF